MLNPYNRAKAQRSDPSHGQSNHQTFIILSSDTAKYKNEENLFVFANIINIITVDRDSLHNLLTDKRRPTYELCVRPTLTTAGGLYMYVCFYDGRQQISLDNRRSSSPPALGLRIGVVLIHLYNHPITTIGCRKCHMLESTATFADCHECGGALHGV